MQGYVHSLESFGTVDGPGIRFVVFLQGCPLRCKYCHNPDTWTYGSGKLYESQEIFDMAMKYKHYFSKGGGITLTGGEPLLQMDFSIELLKKFKDAGVHTAVDTSGYMFDKENKASVEKHLELCRYTDLFLLDIKHISSQRHKELTGVPNEHTLDFARFLDEQGKKMWIRYVLVPGWTDDEKDIRGLRAFLDTLGNVDKVEVLPYHTMGVPKYQKLGIAYPLEGVPTPTKEQVALARKILRGDR